MLVNVALVRELLPAERAAEGLARAVLEGHVPAEVAPLTHALAAQLAVVAELAEVHGARV